MTSCPVCGGHILPDGSCMNNCGAYYPEKEKRKARQKYEELRYKHTNKQLLKLLELHLRRLALRAAKFIVTPTLGKSPPKGDVIDHAAWTNDQHTCNAITDNFTAVIERQIRTCTRLIQHLEKERAWPRCSNCGNYIEWQVLVENPSEYCQKCNADRVRERHGRYY